MGAMKHPAFPLNNHLSCPQCRGENLHHGRVTIYDRDEDASRVTKIEVWDHAAQIKKINNEESGNPSLRRYGLAIQFWCEQCDTSSELTVAQHKGQSLIGWRGQENGRSNAGS
jgi:hypothetical protein